MLALLCHLWKYIITKYNISVKVIYCAKYQWQPRWPKLKKSTLFECQCILHGSTNWEHHFYVPNWREARHFTMVSQATKDMSIHLNDFIYTDSNAVMTSKGIKWCRIVQHESHSQQPLVNFKIIWLLSVFLMGVLLIRWFLQLTPDKSNHRQLEPCTSELLLKL